MDAKQVDVTCPCCRSHIVFDVRTRKVLKWRKESELDEDGKPKVTEEDWQDVTGRVKGRLDTAADKFAESLGRERSRAKDLDDLFAKQRDKLKKDEEE